MQKKLKCLFPPKFKQDKQALALVYFTLFMSLGGVLWGVLAVFYGLYLTSLIPFGYVVLSILNLLFWNLFPSKIPFNFVKGFQSFISISLPFLLQIILGGFVASGGVMMWAFLALIALLGFYSIKGAIHCVLVFLLFTLSVLYFDTDFHINSPKVFQSDAIRNTLLAINLSLVSSMLFSISLIYVAILEKALKDIKIKNDKVIMSEHKQSNQLRLIMSSINYAKRIQNALLPQKNTLDKFFKGGFVFFKPRDIVSGDFYWFFEKDNKIYIALADCTGHGVPGAFMSMLGISSLNKIINLYDYQLAAHEILEVLHLEIRLTLKQYSGENNDGMDIGLCVIDKETQNLTFTGAKVPLCYFQNDEFFFIKGNRMPIGGLQKEYKRTFEEHTIDISQETTFYLFTDGYPDQFGGPDNKKFSSKELRDLLYSIHELPMEAQEIILAKTIHEWQETGQEEQIDDISVLGIKV